MGVDLVVKLLAGLLDNTKASAEVKVAAAKTPKLEDGYYIWEKGDKLKLSFHFSTSEFSCHCQYPDCKKQKIAKELIDKLELVRTDVDQPLVITSAYRCVKYQAFLKAAGVNTVVAKLSQHELGNAADVIPRDGKGSRTSFLDICDKYFNSIGLSDKFLHLDLRKDKIRWEY